MTNNDVAKLYQSTKDLAKLVKIQKTALAESDLETLYDHIVHLGREMVDYEFAALVLSSNNQIVKISDVELKKDSLVVTVIKDIIQHIPDGSDVWNVNSKALADKGIEHAVKYLFEHTLVVALKHHDVVIAHLIISRKVPWEKRELVLLDHLKVSFAVSVAGFFPDIEKKQSLKKKLAWLYHKKVRFLVLLTILAALFLIRVPLTVIAPAEVTSKNPVLIQASIDGVIDEVYVTPNIYVKKGDKLLSLDKEKIQSQLNILQKRQDLIQTQYKIASKLGIRNEKEKQNIPIYNMELKKNLAEIEYYKYLLSQTEIVAPEDGLVLFDHVHKLEGKPIRTGETIMFLANESESALDIYLPVSDAIELAQAAQIRFFLNVAPRDPVDAQIEYYSYQAEIQPDGSLAYHIRANFSESDQELPRIGLMGSAKLYGEDTTVFYYLFRKPLSFIREKLGI